MFQIKKYFLFVQPVFRESALGVFLDFFNDLFHHVPPLLLPFYLTEKIVYFKFPGRAPIKLSPCCRQVTVIDSNFSISDGSF
jgi:hypothetical protein